MTKREWDELFELFCVPDELLTDRQGRRENSLALLARAKWKNREAELWNLSKPKRQADDARQA
jgi:predicted CopG family antitoxin